MKLQLDYKYKKRVLGMYSDVNYRTIIDDTLSTQSALEDEQIENIAKVLKQNDSCIKMTMVNDYWKEMSTIALLSRNYKNEIELYTYSINECNIDRFKLTTGNVRKVCERINNMVFEYINDNKGE